MQMGEHQIVSQKLFGVTERAWYTTTQLQQTCGGAAPAEVDTKFQSIHDFL